MKNKTKFDQSVIKDKAVCKALCPEQLGDTWQITCIFKTVSKPETKPNKPPIKTETQKKAQKKYKIKKKLQDDFKALEEVGIQGFYVLCSDGQISYGYTSQFTDAFQPDYATLLEHTSKQLQKSKIDIWKHSHGNEQAQKALGTLCSLFSEHALK